MATSVDICNLALSILGDDGTVVSLIPPNCSDQAGHCARWYPVALRRILESNPWSFATKRSQLTKLNNVDASIYGYKGAYALPSQFMRALKIESAEYLSEGIDSDLYPELGHFELGLVENNTNRVLFCNVTDPVLTYVAYVDNASLFPGYFVDALMLLLASYLYGPVKRADTTSQTVVNIMKQYEAALTKAKTEDAQISMRRREAHYLASQLRAREVW